MGDLEPVLDEAEQATRSVGFQPLSLFFRFLPPPVLYLAAIGNPLGLSYLWRQRPEGTEFGWPQAGIAAGAGVVAVILLQFLGRAMAKAKTEVITASLARSHQLAEASYQKSRQEQKKTLQEIDETHDATIRDSESHYTTALGETAAIRDTAPAELEARGEAIAARWEKLATARREKNGGGTSRDAAPD